MVYSSDCYKIENEKIKYVQVLTTRVHDINGICKTFSRHFQLLKCVVTTSTYPCGRICCNEEACIGVGCIGCIGCIELCIMEVAWCNIGLGPPDCITALLCAA